jgi:hypothetical protein
MEIEVMYYSEKVIVLKGLDSVISQKTGFFIITVRTSNMISFQILDHYSFVIFQSRSNKHKAYRSNSDFSCVGFQVLTAVVMKVAIFWDYLKTPTFSI